MANAKIGSQTSWNGNYVETIDTSGKQLTLTDSGKVFICNAGSATVLVNLPKLATDMAGWHCKFLMKTAGAADFSILAWGLPIAGGTGDSGVTNDGDSVIFKEHGHNSHTGASSKDGISFVGGNATIGTIIEAFSDGSNWFLTSFVVDPNQTAAIDS
jgi:hypothetical protein